MTAIRYPNDKWFHTPHIARHISMLLTPELFAEKLFATWQKVDDKGITYYEEKYSDYSDPNRITELPKIEDGSLFPYVKFEGLDVKHTVTETYGLSIEFLNECRRNKTMLDFIRRGYNRASFWLAFLMNTKVLNAITNSFSTTTATELNEEPWNDTATAVWSDKTNRVPLDDINVIKLMINDTEGYNYEAADAYLQWSNFTELENYFQTEENLPWAKDPTTGQWNRMINGILFHPVHKLSGIPADTVLIIARNHKPTTIYERIDPNFSRGRLKDNSGNMLPALHMHKFFWDKTHSLHFQLWREFVALSTREQRKGVGILTGI